ncbi:hypothetical protein [Amycolatopsis sp.]|uniref:hypothetical protein n=1 Tax=Amycolatopsis sp. TaxID=37632 RepID=UPI002C452C61|nr:hypothetical protein [Amycolatopsis sp.]HVV11571.1 hypothetical protein [Amycolatopsis sp.]
MTTPQFPDEPNYWLRRLFEAVDGIDKKIDGHAEKLVALEGGHAQLRKEVDEIKADDHAEKAARQADDRSGRAVRRANVTFAITTLIAIVGVIAQILIP